MLKINARFVLLRPLNAINMPEAPPHGIERPLPIRMLIEQRLKQEDIDFSDLTKTAKDIL